MSLLSGFTAGLLLITLSELGDKTFFIGALLAMRHPRRWVFIGVSAALAAMTILSVLVGQVAALFPQHYVRMLAIALFIGCGLKLLYDGLQMSGNNSLCDEQAEAVQTLQNLEAKGVSWSLRTVLMQAFALTFVAEWGDRTQFTTITLSAANNPYGVVIGAILGHAICAAIAVICGRMIAGYISERILTLVGGCLFVLFGILTAMM